MMDRVGFAGENDIEGLSESLWKGIDFRDYMARPNLGTLDYDNFTSPLALTAKSTATQVTAGTFAMLDADRGVARIASSGTAAQGINLQFQLAATGYRQAVPALGKMVFEARVRPDTISTPGRYFIGVAPWNTAIVTTAPALTTGTQYAGFHAISTATLSFTTRKSASTTSNAGTLGTLVHNTWIKLGFVIDKAGRCDLYVDGVYRETIVTNVHDGAVIPTFFCHSSGTVTPNLDIDWYALAIQNAVQ